MPLPSAHPVTLLLIGTADTKADELTFLRAEIEALGHTTLIMDVGVLRAPSIVPDIDQHQVATAGGLPLAQIVSLGGENLAMQRMARGAAVIAADLCARRVIDGVLAIGGTMGTDLALEVTQALPLGVTKLIVSSVAFSHIIPPERIAPDLMMILWAGGLWGLNTACRSVLRQAAGATVGAALANRGKVTWTRPVVGISSLGSSCTRYLGLLKPALEARGYEVVVFHAVGPGGRALESLIEQGRLVAVLDLTLIEVSNHTLGSVVSAGANRLEAAGRLGVPQIVAPGAIDGVDLRPWQSLPDFVADRVFHPHNRLVGAARTSAAEKRAIASHHNIDIWRAANPVGEGVGSPTWANWGMSGPWLCAHLYEHYLFTSNSDFLRNRAYPLMKGAAEFCLAWLIEDGKGHLTTCPSESTENNFLAPDGKPAFTSAGCTMDMALIRELFGNCSAAAKELRIDADFAAKLDAAVLRLIPYQIGRYGQLQEWSVDFEEATPGQRHMSHMYLLYPGNQITPRRTPELARAARVSLERRLANGGAYTGWSRAWAIAFWTRLLTATRHGSRSPCSCSIAPTSTSSTPTLPGKTSIFQIDGNFGTTAAIGNFSCKATKDQSISCPRFQPHGPKALSKVFAQEADSRSIFAGVQTNSLSMPSARYHWRTDPSYSERSNDHHNQERHEVDRLTPQPGGSYLAHFESAHTYRLTFSSTSYAM